MPANKFDRFLGVLGVLSESIIKCVVRINDLNEILPIILVHEYHAFGNTSNIHTLTDSTVESII